MRLLDLFAGLGVGKGAASAGFEEYGVELDDVAVKSRELNGLRTVARDVWQIDTVPAELYDVIWASPPCQTFSTANGRSDSTSELNIAIQLLKDVKKIDLETLKYASKNVFKDERSALALTPLAYVERFQPKGLVLEQVVPVLGLWEAFKPYLESRGYHVWVGVLDAADFGVPQNRRRAYLVASKKGVTRPEGISNHKTMFEALGWGITDRPAPTVTSKTGVTRSATGTQKVYMDAIERGAFVFRPDGDPTHSKRAKSGIGSIYPPGLVNTTVEDNLVLQGFPAGTRLAGNVQDRSLQVGNAVPPPVAEHILKMFKEVHGE